MGTRQIEFQIAANPPPRLDKALSRDVPDGENLSRTRLARLIEEGAVQIDGTEARDPKAKVPEGAQVTIAVAEAEDSHIGPEDIPLEVVFEDCRRDRAQQTCRYGCASRTGLANRDAGKRVASIIAGTTCRASAG